MKKLFVVLGVLGAISFTGLPTAAAVFIWTVALPWAAALQ